MAAPEEDLMPWLGPLLVERGPDGQRRFSDEQAEDFLAALLLSQGVANPARLPPSLLDLLQRFSERAEVPPGADRAVADARVAAYFEAHPIDPALRQTFANRFRAMLQAPDPDDLASAFKAVVDDRGVAKRKDPPKAGPTGALAFFAAHRDVE